MTRSFYILLLSVFLPLGLLSQYRLDWWKEGSMAPSFFQFKDTSLSYGISYSGKAYEFDRNNIDSIGRKHNQWYGSSSSLYPAFASGLSISGNNGNLIKKTIGENMVVNTYGYSNGDTVIFTETGKLAGYQKNKIWVYNDTLLTQVKSKNVLPLIKETPVVYYNGINWNPDGRPYPVTTNDLHHVYQLMRVEADSAQIDGKIIFCPHKYSYILCCFTYTGDLLWANDVFDCDSMAGEGLGTLTWGYCYIDEKGVLYFQGDVIDYNGWVQGDFFDSHGGAFVTNNVGGTFVLRVSPKGHILNKKLFNFRFATIQIYPNFSDRFYFSLSALVTSGNNYELKELGYNILGKSSDFTATQIAVIGEMDTAFNIIWHKTLPLEFILKPADSKHGDISYRNKIYFGFPNGAFINDANELLMLGVRTDQIYEDYDRTALFSDTTYGSSKPFIMKVSKDKDFEVLYEFGYNKKGSASPLIGAANICQGKGDDIYVCFGAPRYWGIGSYYPQYGPDSFSHNIFAKISPINYHEPDSTTGKLECGKFNVSLYASSIPDSILWQWGDNSFTRGGYNRTHVYENAGSYSVVCFAWHDGKCWSDTLGITIPFDKRLVDAPDSLIMCGTSAIVRIKDLQSDAILTWSDGGTGNPRNIQQNGWLKSVVTTKEGCKLEDSVFIQLFEPLPDDLIPAEIKICPGKEYFYHIDNMGSHTKLEWPDGSSDSTYMVKSGGEVKLKATRGACEKEYFSKVTIVDTSYTFRFGQEEIVYYEAHPPVLHIPVKAGNISWPDGSHEYDYEVKATDTGLLVVNIDDGCRTYQAMVRIIFGNECPIYIPGSFSPNGDLINDEWKLFTDCSWQEFDLSIYNRWGELIFQSNDIRKSWDGTNAPEGVYFYILSARGSQGTEFRKGTVTVVR